MIADKILNIRIREPLGKETATAIRAIEDGEVIICRCERVTKKEIINYIKMTGTKDFNGILRREDLHGVNITHF